MATGKSWAEMSAGKNYGYKVVIEIHMTEEHYTHDTVCVQRLLKGVFVGKMSCRADRISHGWEKGSSANSFYLDVGPTEINHDGDDYIVMTTSGSDALFIDSLSLYPMYESPARKHDLQIPPRDYEWTWGAKDNWYGWCLSDDEHDNTWEDGQTGRCYKTLLFSMNNNVYYWETPGNHHLCIRPRWGCETSDEIYHADVDCDGDGFTDHTCHSNKSSDKWVVLSGDGACNRVGYHGGGNWKSASYWDCPAAFSVSKKDSLNQGNNGYKRRIETSVLGRLLEATQAPARPITLAPSTSAPAAPLPVEVQPEPLSQLMASQQGAVELAVAEPISMDAPGQPGNPPQPEEATLVHLENF